MRARAGFSGTIRGAKPVEIQKSAAVSAMANAPA
jgi:hypothetical protein